MAHTKRRSTDGIEYAVLSIPDKLDLPVVSYSAQPNLSPYRFYHLYVRASTVRAAHLPLDSNPREPSMNSQVRAMQDTLRDEPSQFHKWNNGMSVVCDSLHHDTAAGTCVLTFSEGEGVCNGGHTYFAIATLPFEPAPDALVHLEVIELPGALAGQDKRNAIAEISRYRNNNTKLALQSLADFQGYYDMFKRAMPGMSNLVRWHENDSSAIQGAISSDHLVRLLAAMDPRWYAHPVFNKKGEVHRSAATAVQSIHYRWYEAVDDPTKSRYGLVHMTPMIRELLEIRDRIAFDLKHATLPKGLRNTSFFTSWIRPRDSERVLLTNRLEKGAAFPGTLDVLFMGLFRTNVWLGLDPTAKIPLVGWYLNPLGLWQSERDRILQALARAFDDFGKEPTEFIRADTPYANDLYVQGTGAAAPKPTVVYEVATFKRYLSEPTNPTHALVLHPVPKVEDLGTRTSGPIRADELPLRESI